MNEKFVYGFGYDDFSGHYMMLSPKAYYDEEGCLYDNHLMCEIHEADIDSEADPCMVCERCKFIEMLHSFGMFENTEAMWGYDGDADVVRYMMDSLGHEEKTDEFRAKWNF